MPLSNPAPVTAAAALVMPGTGVPTETDRLPRAGAQLMRLAAALEEAGVRYCQWKGHARLERLSNGQGDLDLLVDRRSAGVFARVMAELNFKLALPRAHGHAPGILSYLGLDIESGYLLHVHTYFQLVLGRPWGRCYRIPCEQALLDSAIVQIFRTPAPDLDLMLFVLRSTLRHRPDDVMRRTEPTWLRLARVELEQLEKNVGPGTSARTLARHMPWLTHGSFERSLESLRRPCPAVRRLRARLELERRLNDHARTPPIGPMVARLAARAARVVHRRQDAGVRKRLAAGGAVIALVGADGAGKSTCTHELAASLSRELDTVTAHLGRPPRSLLTLVVGAALRFARALESIRRLPRPGWATAHFELLRWVCTARDRYRLFRRVQRRARRGSVVICERYPVPEQYALAGPSQAQGEALAANHALSWRLRRIERSFYARICAPDLVVELRVDPETAVRRKVDEPADYVRRRARTVWETPGHGANRRAVDAGRPLADVLVELRSCVWQVL